MSVAAIVPALNEEKTIGDVINVLVQSPLLSEVIVVSDGSTDRTVHIAKEAGATVVEHSKTAGKGETMLTGVKSTKADIVVFFDADLRGFNLGHIEQLVLPVLNEAKVMNAGIRDRGPLLSFFSAHLPLISGERAMKREIIENIPPQFLQGYMVESALNFYCRSKKMAYGSVLLSGLTIRTKVEKVGILHAVVQYIRMFVQIVHAMLIVRLAHLIKKF